MHKLPDWHGDSDGVSASNGPAVLQFNIPDHVSAALTLPEAAGLCL